MATERGNLCVDGQLMACALDELDKLGAGLHVSICWGPEMTDVPGRPGVAAPVPHWIMLVSAPNPNMDEPRLNAVKDLGFGEPGEAHVRAMIRDAVTAMNSLGREKLAQKMAGGNGHP